jgi:hypothetical protein
VQRLFDVRMADGSRRFGELPERYDVEGPQWHRLREHVEALAGVRLLSFVSDDVTEAWLVFSLSGQEFSLNNQQGKWCVFVRDAACPDELLIRVLDYLERMLAPDTALARGFGPIAAGSFRVVVYDEERRLSFADFVSREIAAGYADDYASEDVRIMADVFDDQFRHVGRGQHYALRAMEERERDRGGESES